MSRTCKVAVFVLLGLVGIALILNFRTPAPNGWRSSNAAGSGSVKEAHLVPVELTSFYDDDTSFDGSRCWQAVPRGLQTFGNIPFRVAGLIELWGEGPA